MTDLEAMLQHAMACGAQSLLLTAGNPPALRIGGVVQAMPGHERLRFQDTEAVARRLLTDDQATALELEGSVEVPFRIGSVQGHAAVFYGMGCHNVVMHLDRARAT